MVEIVGVAGAGKSSLSRALSGSDGRFVQGLNLDVRSFEQMPTLVMNTLFLLPDLLRLSLTGTWPTRQEIRMMVYLRGWHRVLHQQASSDNIVVLDHGPVFKLTRLRFAGLGGLRRRGFEPWWEEMLRRWATRLNLLIWLDAADATLLERICSRTGWHEVKDMSEREALKYLAGYRRSYEEVILKLTTIGKVRVVRFDSDENSTHQILVRTLAYLGHSTSI